MTCAGLEDRIFDEDSRAALVGRSPTPADVEEHLAACPDCAERWAEAAADARRFSEELLLEPPAALRRRLHQAFPRRAERSPGVDVTLFSRTLVAGALGASLAGGATTLPDWAGFCVGASLGLAWAAMQRAPRRWRQPAVSAARALRGCVQLLRPI
jgi:anti-sigma factor RsiW